MNSGKCRDCYNAYMREYMLRRYHAQRQTFIDQLGGKCIDCGSIEELEFDHIDPTKKLFTLAKT